MKTGKRQTMKAGSSAHLKAYINKGHSTADLAEILSAHVTSVNGWLKAPDTTPAWTTTIMDQRAKLAAGTAATKGGTRYLLVTVPASKFMAIDAVLTGFGIKTVDLADLVK